MSTFRCFDIKDMNEDDCGLDPSLIHKLAYLDDGMGKYLALTGSPLYGSDIWHAGLATIYMPHDHLSNLEESLQNMDQFALKDIWNTLMCVMEDPGASFTDSHLKIIKE